MTPAAYYRHMADRLRAKAAFTPDNALEWENLSQCYLRLAEQAEVNGRLDLAAEPILRRSDAR